MEKPIVQIYTDGGASPNPGRGGYGTILTFTDSNGKVHTREKSGGYKLTTNNRMELMGVIIGLESLLKPCRVEIFSDAEYVVKAFANKWIDKWQAKNWAKVKNVDLWKRLVKAMEGHSVKFTRVKGHSGHPMNEKCDQLATAAYNQNPSKLLEDTVYVNPELSYQDTITDCTSEWIDY